MKKTALITGISGQDGAYLAEFLLNKNYKIIGTDRRSARGNNWRLNRLGILNKIHYEEMELGELYEIERIFKKYDIDEVYNLAAQSFVATSFKSPLNTSNVTGLEVLRILETIKSINRKIKFYQASSSEMFGKIFDKKQSEKTQLNPQSPYAISKVFGHYMTDNYRKSYGMYAVSGILFNHESERRGIEFVTRKISDGVAKIKLGLEPHITLGNLDAERDWGYAPDYVEAMWLMLQQETPDDYVIATNNKYSIRDFLSIAFNHAGINDWGGISPVTRDFINPQHPWPNINSLESIMNEIGFRLMERLTVYPKFNTQNFLSTTIRSHMLKHSAYLHPDSKLKELETV